MKMLRTICSRIRSLWRRPALKREIDEELRFHIEQRTAEYVAGGTSPEEAARKARKRFGNVQDVREECRETSGASFGETTLQDVRFGLRMLRKSPGFATVAVLTLALGIGACTAIFSVVNGVLLRALPHEQPGQLVCLWEDPSGKGQDKNSAAGTATTLPMAGWTDSSVRAEGRPDQDQFYISTDYDFVSGNYYRALGMPLLRGRLFTGRDDSTNAPRVAILNEALAGRVFPQENPLGRRLQFHGQWWEVVGIVGNVRHRGLDRNTREHIYLPQAFSSFPCSLVVRTKVPPLALAETVRNEILKLDPDQPVSNVRTLEQIVANAAGQRRLMLGLLGLFAAAAVLLAAIGLYGVMAFSVSQRTREIGIRMALGAQRGDVLLQVIRQGLKLTMMGVTVGLVGAFALTRVLAHLLFGVTPRDPFTFAGVVILLVTVALVACWLPARRAMRISPTEALRCE